MPNLDEPPMNRRLLPSRRRQILRAMLIALLMTVVAAIALVAQPATLMDGPPRKNLGPIVNGPGAEILPIITPDGKALYFDRKFDSSNTGGIEDPDDAWVANRLPNADWDSARNLGRPFNSAGSDALLWASADGNRVLVYSDTLPLPHLALMKRSGTQWGAPQSISIEGLSNLGETYFATITPDERRLILTLAPDSSKPDNLDLYVSTLASPDLLTWSRPSPLSAVINTTQYEGAPYMAWDNRTLYYASERFGGMGGADIFVSRRIGDSWAAWSQPVNLGPRINSPAGEESLTLPWFDTWGYVSAPGEYGQTDIFQVRLPDDLLPQRVIVVLGSFRSNDRGVIGLIRAIRADDGTEIGSVSSDIDGAFTLILPPNESYVITGWSGSTGEVQSRVDGKGTEQGVFECVLNAAGEKGANGGEQP